MSHAQYTWSSYYNSHHATFTVFCCLLCICPPYHRLVSDRSVYGFVCVFVFVGISICIFFPHHRLVGDCSVDGFPVHRVRRHVALDWDAGWQLRLWSRMSSSLSSPSLSMSCRVPQIVPFCHPGWENMVNIENAENMEKMANIIR